jgi:hypothetical protein
VPGLIAWCGFVPTAVIGRSSRELKLESLPGRLFSWGSPRSAQVAETSMLVGAGRPAPRQRRGGRHRVSVPPDSPRPRRVTISSGCQVRRASPGVPSRVAEAEVAEGVRMDD